MYGIFCNFTIYQFFGISYFKVVLRERSACAGA